MKKIMSIILSIVMIFSFSMIASAKTLYGVDVYHGNGVVDWQKVSQSKDFAYIKATQGEHFTDSQFDNNAKNLNYSGMQWGAYHFMNCYGVESAKLQARRFYETIKGKGYTLKPALDIEVADGYDKATDIRAMITAFCNEFKEISGQDCIVYTYTFYFNKYSLEKLNIPVLWQADYRQQRGSVKIVPSIWQYSSTGKVDGIPSKVVDLNVMYDDKAFLKSSAVEKSVNTVQKLQTKFNPSTNSVVGKNFDIYNSQGYKLAHHSVFKGDTIKIIGIDYDRQLLHIKYPVKNYYVDGYIKNEERYLHNKYYNKYLNGKTAEIVYNANGEKIGSLFAHEKATILGKADNGMTCILYNTKKGTETKSGFVKFGGLK